MNFIKLSNTSQIIRLTVYKQPLKSSAIAAIGNKTCSSYLTHGRRFSVQSTVQSQTGIFQSISQTVPVEYLQNFLVTVHDQCGLPWWATVISSTIVLRSCITVPFAIYQQNILAKVENISTKMPAIAKELQKETSLAVKLYKWDEKTAKYQYRRSMKKQWNKLIIEENCHPLKATVLLWVQIPLWIFFSMALRNLVYMLPKTNLDAYVTYTELTLGGFGWIPNLTEVDTSYILPITMALLNLIIIEIQVMSKTRPITRFQRYINNFFRGISVCMIPIASSVPSCLVLYWTTSSAYSLFQNLVLLSPKIKRFCKIPRTPSELSNPYDHIANSFKNKYMNSLKLK